MRIRTYVRRMATLVERNDYVIQRANVGTDRRNSGNRHLGGIYTLNDRGNTERFGLSGMRRRAQSAGGKHRKGRIPNCLCAYRRPLRKVHRKWSGSAAWNLKKTGVGRRWSDLRPRRDGVWTAETSGFPL